MKKRNLRAGFAPILIILLIAVLAGAAGYVVVQKNKHVQPVPSQNSTSTVATNQNTTSTVDTTSWKTYRNEKYGFEFRYPREYQIAYETEEEIVLDGFRARLVSEKDFKEEEVWAFAELKKLNANYDTYPIDKEPVLVCESDDGHSCTRTLAQKSKLDNKPALHFFHLSSGSSGRTTYVFIGNDILEIRNESSVYGRFYPYTEFSTSTNPVFDAKLKIALDNFEKILTTLKFIK